MRGVLSKRIAAHETFRAEIKAVKVPRKKAYAVADGKDEHGNFLPVADRFRAGRERCLEYTKGQGVRPRLHQRYHMEARELR